VGRDLQREFGQEPQVVMTMPILPGTDGVEKMSKSLGNHIGIADPFDVMFGKTMSIPDAALPQYLTLVSDLDADAVRQRIAALDAGSVNPSHVKRELGRDLVRQFHGDEAAVAAEQAFDRVFVQHATPDVLPEIEVAASEIAAVDAIVAAGLAPSRSEARRLVRQGAVEWEGRRVADEQAVLRPAGDAVLKVGKRRFAKLKFQP
jgi:tyrosyl-tRNA synthetase